MFVNKLSIGKHLFSFLLPGQSTNYMFFVCNFVTAGTGRFCFYGNLPNVETEERSGAHETTCILFQMPKNGSTNPVQCFI